MVAQFKTEYWLNSSGQVAQSGADYSLLFCMFIFHPPLLLSDLKLINEVFLPFFIKL